MFTGIIEAVGSVASIETIGGDRRIGIGCGQLGLDDVGLGDSIAVNGICLTVVARDAESFTADVSHETLSLTTSGEWQVGTPVNLEKSLTLATRLGGHLVSGHIDGTGTVLSRVADARSTRFEVGLPPELVR